MERNPSVDWEAVDDVIFGCANQAGEDNRKRGPHVSAACRPSGQFHRHDHKPPLRSGMDAVITAARAIKSCESELVIAGGVESMSRAPFVMPKADTAFPAMLKSMTPRSAALRQPLMKKQYGVDSMPETGDNVAIDYKVTAKIKTHLRSAVRPRPPRLRPMDDWQRKSFRSAFPSARVIRSSSSGTSIPCHIHRGIGKA